MAPGNSICAPCEPSGRLRMRAPGRFGRLSLRLLQERPPPTEQKPPADPATTISSSFTGDTARSRRPSPTIDCPRNAVTLSQFFPLLSERYTNWPKAYTRGLAPAGFRTCAPFSGRLGDRPSARGGTVVPAAAAVHPSKSLVSNVFPDDARIETRSPGGEHHTRSTGPVASPARSRSMAAFPTPLQSGAWATAEAASASPIRSSAGAARHVALLPMERVHCTLTYRPKRPETADFSSPRTIKSGSEVCLQEQ